MPDNQKNLNQVTNLGTGKIQDDRHQISLCFLGGRSSILIAGSPLAPCLHVGSVLQAAAMSFHNLKSNLKSSKTSYVGKIK